MSERIIILNTGLLYSIIEDNVKINICDMYGHNNTVYDYDIYVIDIISIGICECLSKYRQLRVNKYLNLHESVTVYKNIKNIFIPHIEQLLSSSGLNFSNLIEVRCMVLKNSLVLGVIS